MLQTLNPPPVIYIVTEDTLSLHIAKKILDQHKPDYTLFPIRVANGKTYILKRILDYNKSAKGLLFFVMVDLDKEMCAKNLIRNCFKKTPKNKNLIFRVVHSTDFRKTNTIIIKAVKPRKKIWQKMGFGCKVCHYAS